MVLGKKIFIGLSTRSNQQAVNQLNQLLGEYGYTVTGLAFHDCLHLKTAVTRVDNGTLLINRNWVDTQYFGDYELIDVDPAESFGANCLPIEDKIIYSSAYPKTRAKLEAKGYKIVSVELDELAKAEGAVTCCSLVIAN